jgi:MFS family permease
MKLGLRLPKIHVLPLVIATAFFMYGLDTTIIATALPSIAQTFHTSPVRLSITVTFCSCETR